MDKEKIIITTALTLFVENGFHGTATSRIAQDAGIANGTLFNYFATKEILIISIYNKVIRELENYIIESIESNSVSKESFRSLFSASLQWNLDNRLKFQYLQQFNNSPYSKVSNANALKSEEHPLYVLIQNGINLVLLKPMAVGLIFSLINAHINGLYYYIISNDFTAEKKEEISMETFELLWKMIED